MKKTVLLTILSTSILLAACGPSIIVSPPRQTIPDVLAEDKFDFGDAPETYRVLLADDGGRTHNPYPFWLGPLDSVASLEEDAKIINLDEAEDGLVGFLATAGKDLLTIRLSNSKVSPGRDVYLNGLIDSNADGRWGNFTGPGGLVEEWFLVNKVIHLEPGESVTIKGSAPLAFGTLETWIRLVVSDTPVKSDNWDGAGFWELGEVEDYLVQPGGFDTPTPWIPWITPTPTATATPKKWIETTPGGNSTPTATATPTKKEWIETKKGGPTDTPTPPPDCSDPANLRPECAPPTLPPPPPPPESPIWSGNICGGIDLYSGPGGQLIRRVDQNEHVYMFEIRSDGWTRVMAGQDSGWIQPNWADKNQFGYDGHPCQAAPGGRTAP